MGSAHGREIPLVCVVRPFAILNIGHELGDDEVDVGVPLAMGVGRHVDRHVIDGGGEVGAVIEIDSSQVVLVRLAFAAVLADEQAGDPFEQFARSQDRSVIDLLRR